MHSENQSHHHPFALAAYSGSTDYERLADIATRDSIIVIIDSPQRHKHLAGVRALAQTSIDLDAAVPYWAIVSPGINHIYAESREEFMEMCAQRSVQFFDPAIQNITATKWVD